MVGYIGKLEKDTLANTYFRQVVFTAPHSQLVLMSLKPLEEIGMEVHPDNDQFLRFEQGEGKAIIGGEEFIFGVGDCVIVPAGENHNIINTSATEELKLYTVYSPAHHPEGTIHKTKEEAMAAE
ncbi:MAG TPA: cupin domain-containing protein [Patescibacteria group bacterium]|nr:cupin domain-containing protein [Patescibacteria group bacterium]